MIAKGSIKLRIMSELTEKGDGKVASLYWKDTRYKEHETAMIKKFAQCLLFRRGIIKEVSMERIIKGLPL